MKELEDFLSTLDKLEKIDNHSYKFIYNDVYCYGQVITLPNTLQLIIRPLKSSDKIGEVSGEAIFKTFKRENIRANLLKDLSTKDIVIGFSNYLADNKINRSVIVIDGIRNNAWFDNNKAKYTNIDSIFNEYLNTLK